MAINVGIKCLCDNFTKCDNLYSRATLEKFQTYDKVRKLCKKWYVSDIAKLFKKTIRTFAS